MGELGCPGLGKRMARADEFPQAPAITGVRFSGAAGRDVKGGKSVEDCRVVDGGCDDDWRIDAPGC